MGKACYVPYAAAIQHSYEYLFSENARDRLCLQGPSHVTLLSYNLGTLNHVLFTHTLYLEKALSG